MPNDCVLHHCDHKQLCETDFIAAADEKHWNVILAIRLILCPLTFAVSVSTYAVSDRKLTTLDVLCNIFPCHLVTFYLTF